MKNIRKSIKSGEKEISMKKEIKLMNETAIMANVEALPGGGFHGGEQTETLPGGGFHGGEQTETLPGGGFHGGEQTETLPGGGFH